MKDIDIFGYNLGGSVSQMIDDPTLSNVSQEPPLTAAQLAYFASQFVPGAGTLDSLGQMAGTPPSDADLVDLFDAENYPSAAENLGSGNYLDALFQGLGLAGDFAYAIPAVGPAIGAVMKAPRAVQKTIQMATKAKMSRKDLTEKFRQEQEALGVKPATVKTRANTYKKSLETPAVFRRERLRAEGEIATFDPQARIIQAPESLLGKVLVPVAGDRSLSIQGQGISSLIDVNGVPLSRAVPVQGGPDYMIINEGRGAGWASMEGIAQSKQNNITLAANETGLDPVGVYSAMARDGIDFSAPVATAMVAQIPAIGLPKSAIKEFDDAMRRGIGDQTNPKKKPTLKARPDWVGLESPDAFNQLLGEGGFPMKGAGQIRTALVTHMKKDMFAKQGFPVYADVVKTITMPELANVPRGSSGFAMFDAVPNASIFDDPIHQSYNKSIAGKYLGGLEQGIPPEIMFPDTFNMLSRSVNSAGKLFPYDQQVGALERRHLFESMTDEKVDAMNRFMNQNYGTDYADGGSVDKIDIFGYNMGGSVGEMMGRESSLKLTPENMAYIAAQLPVGAGTLDALGQMRAMGSGDRIFADQNNLSLSRNLDEGNYLDAGFQGMGLVGDALSVMGPVGLGVGSALKLPRALQKMSRLDNAADSSGIASIDQIAAIAPDGIESVDAARLAAIDAGDAAPNIDEFIPNDPDLADLQNFLNTAKLDPESAVAVQNHPAITRVVSEMHTMPETQFADGYGTDKYFQERQFSFKNPDDSVTEIVGLDDAVDRMYDNLKALGWTDEKMAYNGSVKGGFENPTATIILGPPASGKSSVANPLARKLNAAILDPDEVKKAMPEFAGGVGSNATHVESKRITKDIRNLMIANRNNIVIPTVGANPQKIMGEIKAYKDAGYQVNLVDVVVPKEEALRRMLLRFIKSGKLIPPEYMGEVGDLPSLTYDILRKEGVADGYARIDNSVGIEVPKPLIEDTADIFTDAEIRLQRGR